MFKHEDSASQTCPGGPVALHIVAVSETAPYPLYSALYRQCQPFCSAVRILSERLIPYIRLLLLPTMHFDFERTTDVHSLKHYFPQSNAENRRAGAREFEWEMPFTSFLFLL